MQQKEDIASIECLARNLSWETSALSHKPRDEEQRKRFVAEQEAIMKVVFNRMRLGRRGGYEDTVCKVVYQHAQFSWTLTLPRDAKPKSEERWRYMLGIARRGLAQNFETTFLPEQGYMLNYKRADNVGVAKRPDAWFRKNTTSVGVYNDHEFFCPKKMKTAGPQKKRA